MCASWNLLRTRLNENQVLGEICLYLKAINIKRKGEFDQLLTTVTFPAMQLPEDKAREFVSALNTAPDGKLFKKVQDF
jgi:hypothetical protein